MLDREINQQSTKLPPYFVFCFGITYDCVKRVQASNNTLLDKPVNGVACPSNVESEAPNMRIDIQKRNMQQFAGRFPAGSVLVLMARNAKGLDQTKSTIEANSPSVRVRTVPVDLGAADEDSLRQYLAKVVKELGVVAGDFEQACVVHNAASLGDVSKHVTQHISTTEMRKYWDVNLTSAVVLNAVFLGMFPSDEVRQRVVIQTSSICALQPFKSWSLYCAGRPNTRLLSNGGGACPLHSQKNTRARTHARTHTHTLYSSSFRHVSLSFFFLQISIHIQKRQPSLSSFAKNSSPEIYESRRRGYTPVPNLTRLPMDSLEVTSVLSGAVSRNIESCQSSAVLSPLLSHTLPPPRYRCPSILRKTIRRINSRLRRRCVNTGGATVDRGEIVSMYAGLYTRLLSIMGGG